ncbi:T6SS immunity protein Tdi1 domain-containing protein [Promicromonospora sp. NPDC060271]|uniref:T6SS immunity protein Tdi1 domain-containing protein n=1 Tax=Promicromonospora sp. NPDC060271 TaxID=3347089 RepID=UPI00365840BE
MKLLRTFPKVSFEFGLSSWQWLGLREQTPRFATCFGDIFLESLDGWWFLDTVEGTLELRWASAVTMYAELESAEGRATYLMDDLVRDARSRGIHLGEEDVYAFNPHPALGGELGVNGLGAMRFELAVNWVGQMHDQLLHNPGEIHLPPMPDDGRRTGTSRTTAAWDGTWSQDETFDVPFEQYLATTTFAAVAAPGQSVGSRSDGARPYKGKRYAAPVEPEQPAPVHSSPTPSWSGQSGSVAWSGQTETAQQWPEPSQAHEPAAPLDGYAAGHDPAYPAAEQYGTAPGDQWAGGSGAAQGWLPYDDGRGSGGQDHRGQAGPTWNSPGWGSPTWAGPTWDSQPPALAAGGSPQQAPRADDPFTAWDDLWGRH